MFLEIDNKLRLGFSLLYRVILAGYLLFILFCEEGWDEFPWMKYSISVLIYFTLFFILKSKKIQKIKSKKDKSTERIKAIARLIIDYTLIIFILKGYQTDEFQNYFILIIPIINSINHSIAESKNTIVYFTAIFSIFYLDNWNFYESKIIPVVILFVIIQFFMIRHRISSYKDKLFQVIDEFYGTNATKKEMTLVLQYLSNQLNKSLKGIRFGNLAIKNISCYKQKGDDLILISSGNLVEDYKFENPLILIKKLKKGSSQENIKFKINGEYQPYNYAFKARGNNYVYYYVITFDKPILFLNSFLTLRLVVEPSFKHLSKLLEIKWIINKERSKLYKNVRKKHEYVIKSMEVLHFVKGALSPFSILRDAITLHQGDKDIERKERTMKRIYNLNARSNSNFDSVSLRAEMIYDKSANPFTSDKKEVISFSELFTWIRRNFEEYTNSKDVLLIKESSKDINEMRVEYDEELFYAVLIEIFENINKHAGDFQRLIFTLKDDVIEVAFRNDLKNSSNRKIEEIKRIASKHNADSRPTINQRESDRFGMYIMKDYLYQMSMKSIISIDSSKIYSHTLIIEIE